MITINNITDVMNYLDGIKVVVFDLDDTLYSEKEYVRSGYHEIAKILPFIKNVEDKLWNFFENKKSAIDELLISENCYSDDLKNKCLETYRNQEPSLHLYPGVEDMLIKLRTQGFKLGMITDGRPEGQRAKLKSLDIEKYFDKIIITDELGGIEYRKPNSLSYTIMKDFFNCDYKVMIYVGDNLRKDFISPQNFGMKYIWIHNNNGLYKNDNFILKGEYRI